MTKKNTICAVIVTYNRKNLLLEALQSLSDQSYPPKEIFIIDNQSTDGTGELLNKKKWINKVPCYGKNIKWHTIKRIKNKKGIPVKIHYTLLPENIGGAGGFHDALVLAGDSSYDWVFIMDDDAEPEPKAFEKLSAYFGLAGIVALAGSVRNPDGSIQANHRGYLRYKGIFPLFHEPVDIHKYNEQSVPIEMISFVGTMIRRSVIEQTGLPRPDFFIHQDDVEYSIRLSKLGQILMIPGCKVFHKDLLSKGKHRRKLFWKTTHRLPPEAVWLSYYSLRNLVFLGKKYSKARLTFYWHVVMIFIRQTIGVLIFDKFKWKRIHCLWRSLADGLREDFSNEYPARVRGKF